MNTHLFIHIPTKLDGGTTRIRGAFDYDRFRDDLRDALQTDVTIIEAPYTHDIATELENKLFLVHDMNVLDGVLHTKSEAFWRRTIILNCDRSNFEKYTAMTELAGLVDTIAMDAWRNGTQTSMWSGIICKNEYFQSRRNLSAGSRRNLSAGSTGIFEDPLDVGIPTWKMLSNRKQNLVSALANYIMWIDDAVSKELV